MPLVRLVSAVVQCSSAEPKKKKMKEYSLFNLHEVVSEKRLLSVYIIKKKKKNTDNVI